MILIIKCLLIAIAAICNSVMDTCREHFDQSIFSRLNPMFWNGKYSWLNKYRNHLESRGISTFYQLPLMQTFSDSWHLFKSLMIICLCCALSLTVCLSFSFFLLQVIVYGAIWIAVFNLFYNKLLKK